MMVALHIFPMQLLSVFLSLICIYLAGKIWTYARLRRFRGEPWTGLTDIPHSLAMLRGDCHTWYADTCNKYGQCSALLLFTLTDRPPVPLGPIARVAPNILITSSPNVWTHVNNTPGYKRSAWFYNACRIEYRRDNVFSETDNERHDRRRKQMAPGVILCWPYCPDLGCFD